MQECPHLEGLSSSDFAPVEPSDGCEECLAGGMHWMALRECLDCGHVGCCDSSPGRHATQHFHDTRHPVIRSLTPGDRWTWCYRDGVYGKLDGGPEPISTDVVVTE